MLQRMLTAKTQMVLFLLTFVLLGTGVANAQSRLDAARAKERELNRAAERVDPDSRDADRIYREAATATRERERIEREESQRSEGNRSALDGAKEKERTLNEAARRVDPNSVDADRIYREAAGATRERERMEREGNQGSENNRSALSIARERERELDAAAQRVNPNSVDADRIYRAAASATRERQRLEGQGTQSAGPTGDYDWDRRSNPVIDGREYSVRERYGNYGVFGYFKEPSSDGHVYDVYESLGRRNLSAEQVAAWIMENLDRVFPLRATGSNGQDVTVGNRFTLSVRGYVQNKVEVTAADKTSFVLEAIPGEHRFRGTVTFQVIKDSSGELWLRQTGRGLPGESYELQVFNYNAADYLWNKMGYNTNVMLNAYGY